MMKRKRYSDEPFIALLKEEEANMRVQDSLPEHSISEQLICRCRAKFGGMELFDAKRLRALEEEDGRLRRMVADLSLDKQILEGMLSKTSWHRLPSVGFITQGGVTSFL